MEQKLLGYEENLLKVNGEYDYHGRSYHFRPIYEIPRGAIATAAMSLCRECHGIIRSMGGGSTRYVCLKCYPAIKIADFAKGHVHVIQE